MFTPLYSGCMCDHKPDMCAICWEAACQPCGSLACPAPCGRTLCGECVGSTQTQCTKCGVYVCEDCIIMKQPHLQQLCRTCSVGCNGCGRCADELVQCSGCNTVACAYDPQCFNTAEFIHSKDMHKGAVHKCNGQIVYQTICASCTGHAQFVPCDVCKVRVVRDEGHERNGQPTTCSDYHYDLICNVQCARRSRPKSLLEPDMAIRLVKQLCKDPVIRNRIMEEAEAIRTPP